MESAQHARHAKMVSEKIPIPTQERHLQHPDGYNIHQDTIVEEYLAGWAYRILPFKRVSFDAFLHYFVPLLFCLGIFGVYGITKEISQSKLAAIFAALFYATAMPAIERSMGNTFFREHLAIPLLIFQLWFMIKAFERGKRKDYLISGVLYFIALSSWKLLNFFTLILFSFFALAYLLNYHRQKVLKMLLWLTGSIVIGTLVFNVSLRYDHFLLSKQMSLAYAIFLLAFINRYKSLTVSKNILLFILFLSGLLWISPSVGLYNHVWETMFSQLRYLGQKPLDPGLLSFEARHYWTPPYTSPSVLRFLNEMTIPLILAGYGILLCLKALKKGKLPFPLSLVLYLSGALFGYYLLCYKIKVFVIVFLAVFSGYALSKTFKILNKRRRAILVGLMLLGLSFQSYQVLAWTDSVWLKLLLNSGVQPREFTKGPPDWAMKDALSWISSNTGKDQALCADINSSPMIAYYANRPIVMHSYFETGIRKRLREFSYALFSETEDELVSFFNKYRARYLFLPGIILLNNDSDMSFRYITDNLKLNPDSLAYKLHFSPKSLKNFNLVYQNPLIRIFDYNPEQINRSSNEAMTEATPPLFDEKLFKQLSIDDSGKYWDNIVVAYHYIQAGQQLLWQGNISQARAFFIQSLKIIPTYQGYIGLGQVYLKYGDKQEAEKLFEAAKTLQH